MFEWIMNNFGWMGLIFVVMVFTVMSQHDIPEKWVDLCVRILVVLSMVGAIHVFSEIGKWILK